MVSLSELRDRRNWFRRTTLSLLLPPRKRPRRCWPAGSVSISSKRQRREPPPPPKEQIMPIRHRDYYKYMETAMHAKGFNYDPPGFPSFDATMKPFLEEYNDSDSDSGSDSDESDYGYNNKNKNDNNHNNLFNIGRDRGRGDGDRGEITTSNNTNNASTITSYRNGEDANHDRGSGSDPESWSDIFADEDSSGNFVYYDPRGEEVVQNVIITTTPMARRGGGLPLEAPSSAATTITNSRPGVNANHTQHEAVAAAASAVATAPTPSRTSVVPSLSSSTEPNDNNNSTSNVEEFYHAIKNDKVGNKILYLDSPLPREMKTGCHPSIRPHLKIVAPRISDCLISNDLVRHPTSKFSMDLEPMSELKNNNPVLYSINKPHQIPLSWGNTEVNTSSNNSTDVDGSNIDDDDNDDDDVEANRDEKPEKIGMTIAGLQKRRELDDNQGDPNRFDRAFIVIDSGLIQAKEDQQIVGILEEFVDAVLADKNVPKQLCLLFKSYRRGGNDLGLRKQWYYQLIEIALQYYFGVGSPAEAFACDCEELESRLSFVQQVDTMLQLYFREYQGKKVTVIESWKTGAKDARLSSQWSLAEYFACDAPLRNAAPNAVYPNATTPEEIFSDDYPETELKQFRNEVMADIEANQRAKGVLLLCHWEKLFSYSKLDKFLSSLGYKLTCKVFQGDLIFYVDSNQESMVAVYHSPGIGLDSRATITLIQSIRRLQLIEIIRRFVLFIQGQQLVDDQKKKGRSLIDTGFIYESVWKHSHQHKLTAAAVARDTYTPSSINATTQNGLGKTSHVLVAPNVRAQYSRNNDHLKENICGYNIEMKRANLLSFTNPKNINATLDTIFNGIVNDNPTRDVLRNRWDKLEQVIRPNSVLLQLMQQFRAQSNLSRSTCAWSTDEIKIIMDHYQNYGKDWMPLFTSEKLPGRSYLSIQSKGYKLTAGGKAPRPNLDVLPRIGPISNPNEKDVTGNKTNGGSHPDPISSSVRISKPSASDILLSYAKGFASHPGNRTYQKVVQSKSLMYDAAKSHREKQSITLSIVHEMKEQLHHRFLKKDKQTRFWIDVTNTEIARQKVAESLRTLRRRRPNSKQQEAM